MRLLLILSSIFFLGCAVSRQKDTAMKPALVKQLRQVLDQSADQYKSMMPTIPEGLLPRTFEKGELKTTRSDGWVSGFYPATLLYLHHYTPDTALRGEALRKMKVLEKEQFNTRTHDLGFMMFCSFGNAARIIPGADYDSIIINSARSLSTRFDPKVGCIRSWDSGPDKFLVIIDNMMNLELLMHAFRMTGDSSFYNISVTHANTTMKHHFREDFSSYHVVDYDPLTGEVGKKHTHQGAHDTSAWARGQAWGLYGYTMMYRETGDARYLEQATSIAEFILDHPRMPADMVPYWDFDAPVISDAYRDASAAAVISSALLELSEYVVGDLKKTYFSTAEKILESLSRAPYKTSGMEAGGFILKHSVGHMPNQSEIDVPLSYGDYYFVEAALRYIGKIPKDGFASRKDDVQRMVMKTLEKVEKEKNAVKSSTTETSIANHFSAANVLISRYRDYLLMEKDRAVPVPVVPAIGDNGRWKDIDYTGNQPGVWQVASHMQRIQQMALQYANPTSGKYRSPALRESISKALTDWFSNRYQSKNWWHNEIGIPRIMRDIIVLMKDDMKGEELKNSLEILAQHKVNGTGANLVWSADLGLHYGALTNNYPMMKACRDTILTVMKISTEEGVQPDFSFHQHGKRLQMYHYGGAFLVDNVRLAWQLANTSLAYPKDKISVLAGFVLNGWQGMARGIHTVPGTIDRAASRKNALHSADIRDLIPLMYDILPDSTAAFRKMLEVQQGKSSLVGYRYYPYSDFTAYHQPEFSFFLKTHSNRTLLTESINQENLKGGLLNSGDSYFVVDGKEYFNLLPYWDWSRIPGITNFKSSKPATSAGLPFTGNVGDQESGIAVMDYLLKRGDSTLKAKKIWVSSGNLVVSLIGGIQTEGFRSNPFTAMDQSRWNGDVSVKDKSGRIILLKENKSAIQLNGDKTEKGKNIKEKEGLHRLTNVHYIHHRNFAYIPLYNDTIELSLQAVEARWSDINRSESSELTRDSVFMPTIIHGQPTSGYVVAFAPDLQKAEKIARDKSWKVLRNDSLAQALLLDNDKLYAALYIAGSQDLGNDLKVTASRPCLLMADKNRVLLSDPSHSGGPVNITINGKQYSSVLPADGTTIVINR